MRALALIAFTAIVLAAVAPTGAAATKSCHNITGACLDHGFVCANEEVVAHSKRCDGVEDCADGTDEFMCHHENDKPMHLRTAEERHAAEQGSCGRCNCLASVLSIARTSTWWSYIKDAPTDFVGLMTGSGTYKGRPCNPDCTQTVTVGFYRKTGICRGGLCCARQRSCDTCVPASGTCSPARSPGFTTRCFIP